MTLDDDVARLLARIGLRPEDLPAHLVDVVRGHLDPRAKDVPMADETLPEAAARYQRAINSTVAGVAADPRRTGYDKVRAAALTWVQHTRSFEMVRAARAAVPRSQLVELVEQHFGYGARGVINSTARALVEMNARNAHADAAAVPVEKIGAELDNAVALGADSLARALARRAYDYRQGDVLNRYLKAFPAEDDGVTKLWNLRKQVERDAKLEAVIEVHMATRLAKPPLIADYSDYDLERLAAEAAPSTSLDPAFEQQIIASTMGTWRGVPGGPSTSSDAA